MSTLQQGSIVELVKDTLLPIYDNERTRLDRIDHWARWENDSPHVPRASTSEYRELIGRSKTPWLPLIVTAVTQALYVEGYRSSDGETAEPWKYWQANGMDRRQSAVHRAAVSYGTSYVTVMPGMDQFGTHMPVIQGHSPRQMIAFYEEDDLDADYPVMALSVIPMRDGSRKFKLFDAMAVYTLTEKDGLHLVSTRRHGVGVCPVIRFANDLDLEGRSSGEVEPYISTAARIDQTIFDRLVTQRFGSFIVRTVTGMAQPDTDAEANIAAIRLRQEDLLVAEDVDTKFGSLPATPLDGFIAAKDADVRDLAAISQTPPHHLLGQVSNLSAEALAASEATLARKTEERRHSFGESWEQTLRIAAAVDGDIDAARDIESQVRWRDVESRSLAQTADALGKLAQMLGVPPQALWERIPGVTQQDVEQWKTMAEENELDLLMHEIRNGLQSNPVSVPDATGADAGSGLV
jgi:predicted nuclease of predicted toxin-antitoxin system